MDIKSYTPEDFITNQRGVAAVIKNEKDEILMQEHIRYGFWTIPVGKAKGDQSIEAALQQEVLEECSIKVSKYKKLATKSYIYDRNGKEIKLESSIFEVIAYTGFIKNNEPEKHLQQIFLGIPDILKIKHLSDATVLYLETLGIKRPASL